MSSLNSRRDIHFFGEIHVLNLEIRKDRKRDMTEQFRLIGVDDDQVHWFYAVEPSEPAGFPTTGYRGNFMSHLSVLELGKKRKLERLVIMEDDLDFTSHFASSIGKVTACLADIDWDMFYGGARVERTKPFNNCLREIDPGMVVELDHFVAFNGDAIGRAYDYLSAMLDRPAGDPQGGPMPVDGAYSWFRREYGLKTFLAEPELGYQRSTRSDLSPNTLDKLPIAREITEALRRFRKNYAGR